jgi:hypothetical protein
VLERSEWTSWVRYSPMRAVSPTDAQQKPPNPRELAETIYSETFYQYLPD